MALGNILAEGNTADIYFRDGKIIKHFKDYISDSAAEYEADKQKCAYFAGLPVPYVYNVTRINNRPAIVMEYIPGDTIGNLILTVNNVTRQRLCVTILSYMKTLMYFTGKVFT